jgi:hypothetical protein
MQDMEARGYHFLSHLNGVIVGLHDWGYSHLDGGQMELPSVQEAARPFRHGLMELTDTCWQEGLQDYDHYGIPMHAEQQWR